MTLLNCSATLEKQKKGLSAVVQTDYLYQKTITN